MSLTSNNVNAATTKASPITIREGCLLSPHFGKPGTAPLGIN